MTDYNPASGDNDNISLDTVKKAASDILRIFFKAVDFIVLSLRRRSLLFLLCCLIGLLGGSLYFFLKPKNFETEMIVQQSVLTRKTYDGIISNLNDLIESKSYADLSAELHCPTQLAKQIVSLEALSLANESLDKDTTTRLGIPFKIRARIKTSTIAPRLQQVLVNYLNSNPYVKQTREGQTRIFLQKLEFIDQEQKKLDSLKETYNRTLASMKLPTTFYNNALNPADLYEHSLNLATQKEGIQSWLNTESHGILLIDGFKSPDNPQSFSLTKALLVGLLSGMGLGFILALLLSIKDGL
ncbi:MAG TPA: hypothetical protein VNR87_09720 [Flavisolibacter sp.]|nr:hypothetical protein [Flavisolibacter sp.]